MNYDPFNEGKWQLSGSEGRYEMQRLLKNSVKNLVGQTVFKDSYLIIAGYLGKWD